MKAPKDFEESHVPFGVSLLFWKTTVCLSLSPANHRTSGDQEPQFVTESKRVLLTAQQGNKSRDALLGQGIATLIEKPADREDGGLMSQRTILPELEFRLLLY